MLRLRSSILTHLPLSSSSASPCSSLCRHLSATAPSISPNPSSYADEEYLVDTCGLTRPQAIKATAKLSHLKSPSNPDAILAFLAGVGLSSADAAAAVAKNSRLLCSKVDKTLAPVVDGLTGLGLSPSEIARLMSLAGKEFRRRSIVSKLQYFLPIFGSSEDLFRVLKSGSHLLCSDLERVVKPNIAFLQECGLGGCDIAKLSIPVPRMLTTSPERVRAMVLCAERLGVPRGSGMFRQALHAVAFLSEDKIATKLEYLKKTFRWSDAEASIAVCNAPFLLRKSKESLKRRSEFLFSEVGLEPMYVAHRSIILCLSLEGRLRPRYYVLKFLKQNGLLNRDLSFCTAVKMTEKIFVEKLICPHKEAAPHLAEDYATACKGEVPINF